MNNVKTKAVFFPGEIDYLRGSTEARQLKQTLIYFDQVFSLIPETAFTGDNWIPGFGERSNRVEQFLLETAVLQESGVLTCINPAENIHPKDMKTHFYGLGSSTVTLQKPQDFKSNIGELLFNSIVFDLEDNTFRELVAELNIEAFPLYTGQLEINWFSMLARAGHQKDMWAHPAPDSSYGGFSAMVSPELGAATLLNHALMTAIRYQATPVANNAQFNRLLQRKFQRISALPDIAKLLAALKRKREWRSDFLAKPVLELALPSFDLKTFEDVLELREKLAEQLEGFRFHLGEASTRIQECEVDEIYSVADDVARNQIAPALMELERKLRLNQDKFILRVFKDLRSAKSSVPLIGTALAGLPIWLGIALGAGATIADAVVETYFEDRETRENNGLTFLLDISNK